MFTSTLMTLSLLISTFYPPPTPPPLRVLKLQFTGQVLPNQLPHLPDRPNACRGHIYLDSPNDGDLIPDYGRNCVVYEDIDEVVIEGPDPCRATSPASNVECELVWFKQVSAPPPGTSWEGTSIKGWLDPGVLGYGTTQMDYWETVPNINPYRWSVWVP